MALFKRPAAASYIGSEVLTIVGPEAFLHGSITVRGSVRVDGEMEGNITEAQEVVVSTTGKVRGNICADSVEIGGEIRGDLICSNRLEVKAGGKVYGNLRTPRLLVEEGAILEGQCSMTEAAAPAAAAEVA